MSNTVALVAIIIGVVVGILSNWVPKPARLPIRAVLALLAVAVLADFVVGLAHTTAGPVNGAANTGTTSVTDAPIPTTSDEPTSSPRSETVGGDQSFSNSASDTTGSAGPLVSAASRPTAHYLSDIGEVSDSGNVTVETGTDQIASNTYPNSVWLCSDVELIANIYCDGSTDSAWVDYNIAANDNTFRAELGFSYKSPSDCDVIATILEDGISVYTKEMHYGDAQPITQSVSGHQRLRLEITPIKGMMCSTVFGSAELSP